MNPPNAKNDNLDLVALHDFSIKTAKETGIFLAHRLDDDIDIKFKGEIDIVTEMDLAAEKRIVDAIKAAYPKHGILTEESSEELSQTSYRWIIDPIDGTTNYAHGFPVFCVSIAFEADGQVLSGVVYDPTRDELFTALKGKGALLNGKSISTSDTATVDRALLATGFPYDIRTSKENNLNHFSNFAVKAQAIRRAGSAALDLSYVACGRFDGFWELKLRPWDIAAAELIIEEAGGKVTDFDGNESSIENKRLLASNSLIHDEMIAILLEQGAGLNK
jgi:myo-inositol-1(or 4)-monophosphatase